MVDIQFATAENRRGKNKKEEQQHNNNRITSLCPGLPALPEETLTQKERRRRKIETTTAKYNGLPHWAATTNGKEMKC